MSKQKELFSKHKMYGTKTKITLFGRFISSAIFLRLYDRISSLPEDVLSHILSLMPNNFAVQTSILSTRWKYSRHWSQTLTSMIITLDMI